MCVATKKQKFSSLCSKNKFIAAIQYGKHYQTRLSFKSLAKRVFVCLEIGINTLFSHFYVYIFVVRYDQNK